MPTKPYSVTHLTPGTKTQTATSPAVTWQVFLEFADTENQKAQRERLSILTHVTQPDGDDPQGLELAAIRRVHDLLGQQIAAMQSR